MVRTFLKVYMELGSYFLFLQEQIKDIIIIGGLSSGAAPVSWQLHQQEGTGHGRSELAPGRHRRATTPQPQHDCIEAVC